MARQTGCNVIPFPGQETTLIKNTKAITTDKSGINSIQPCQLLDRIKTGRTMIMMGQAIGTRQIRVRVSDTVCQEIVRMGKGRTTYVVTHEEYHQKGP